MGYGLGRVEKSFLLKGLATPEGARSRHHRGCEDVADIGPQGISHVGPSEGYLRARNLLGPSGVGRPVQVREACGSGTEG